MNILSLSLSLSSTLSPSLPPPQIMDPTQPKRSLLSSVYSSVASIVGQDGGPPSIFNAVVSLPLFGTCILMMLQMSSGPASINIPFHRGFLNLPVVHFVKH